MACMLGGAGAASASLPSPDSVRPGKNITVFHNVDFVAAGGHADGEQVQVDLIRGGHRVATARGAAVDAGEGGALEVNHEVDGTPLPGNCWEGATPDVRPGDLIRVSSAGGTDEVIVDDIMIDSLTRNANPDPSLAGDPDNDEIWVEGVARSGLDGAPIALTSLDSGAFRDPANGKLRLAPNEVVAGTGEGRFRAVYRAPFEFERNENNVSTAGVLQALMRGEGHEFGFGHTDVVPPDAMLVEGVGVTNGPAAGCEGSTAAASSVGTVDVEVLNAEHVSGLAGDEVALTVGGWAEAHIGEAELELSDEAGATVRVPVTGLDVNAGRQQGWSAGITKGQLAGLAEGELSAQLLVAGDAAGVQKTVLVDTVAPDISVTPEPGSYERAQEVEVTGDEPVTYTLDGGPALRYDDPIEIGTGVHTLELRSEDAAGNVTTRTLEYRIAAPPPVETQPQPQTQPAAPVAPAAEALIPALSTPKIAPAKVVEKAPVARMLGGGARVSRATARRRGLPVAFEAPAVARSATVRAYRTVRGKLRLVATKAMRVKAGRNATTLRSSAIRPGTLTLKVVLRDADGKAGRAASITVRVVR